VAQGVIITAQGIGAALSTTLAGIVGQRDYWSDPRRGHQPAADLILAHDLKQLAVKHAELLAQDPAGDQ
jgi:hypothetical protein